MSSPIEQLEQRDFFTPVGTVPCSRCGQPCRVAANSNPDARLLKHAVRPVKDGLCANCAMSAFIRSVETLMYGIEKNGLAMLRDPRVQASFVGVLQAGSADADPYEIDWEHVIATWDLPLPQISAQMLGRRAVGIERVERFCELAVRRLHEHDTTGFDRWTHKQTDLIEQAEVVL